jgi:hypothetical protein
VSSFILATNFSAAALCFFCSVADLLGYSSHVIDYLWQHDSLGNVDADFYRAQDAVERKMAKFRKVDFSDLVGMACSQSLA